MSELLGPRQANYGSLSAYGYQPDLNMQNITGSNDPYAMNYGLPNPGADTKDNGFKLGDYANLAKSAAGAYLGYQNLKLGRDQFGFAKDAFNVNLANQAKLINAQMYDRELARRSFSGQSTDAEHLRSYLKDREVSGAPV